jgi:hypothetical protein
MKREPLPPPGAQPRRRDFRRIGPSAYSDGQPQYVEWRLTAG